MYSRADLDKDSAALVAEIAQEYLKGDHSTIADAASWVVNVIGIRQEPVLMNYLIQQATFVADQLTS